LAFYLIWWGPTIHNDDGFTSSKSLISSAHFENKTKKKKKKELFTLSLRRGRAPENNEVNFYRMK
jgi:hypothetical protein